MSKRKCYGVANKYWFLNLNLGYVELNLEMGFEMNIYWNFNFLPDNQIENK